MVIKLYLNILTTYLSFTERNGCNRTINGYKRLLAVFVKLNFLSQVYIFIPKIDEFVVLRIIMR